MTARIWSSSTATVCSFAISLNITRTDWFASTAVTYSPPTFAACVRKNASGAYDRFRFTRTSSNTRSRNNELATRIA